MVNSDKNNLFVSPLKLLLLLVFVSVLLIGFTATIQAADNESQQSNPGQYKEFLDPFTLVVKSASEKGQPEQITHPHYEDPDFKLPGKARPRSPFQPGKPE